MEFLVWGIYVLFFRFFVMCLVVIEDVICNGFFVVEIFLWLCEMRYYDLEGY